MWGVVAAVGEAKVLETEYRVLYTLQSTDYSTVSLSAIGMWHSVPYAVPRYGTVKCCVWLRGRCVHDIDKPL